MPATNPAPQPKPPRPATRLLLIAADLYAASAAVYLLLRLLTGDRFWPVRLADTFSQWLLLPGVVLLAVALALRRWRRAAALAIPAAAFLWLFGGLLLPGGRPAPVCANADGCRTLTVMTFNAGKIVPDMAEFAARLDENSVDVVAVQELSTAFESKLESALLDAYPYRVLYGAGVDGIGLLSRYPIVEHDLFYLKLGVFPYLQAELDVDGEPVTVFSVHPPPPAFGPGQGFRTRTIDDLPGLLARVDTSQPVVVMGDFNAADQSTEHRMLRAAGLQDAFREAGWSFGHTFPAAGRFFRVPMPPLVRIDYVWASEHFTPVEAHVGPGLGSDHLPVLATLRLEPRRTETLSVRPSGWEFHQPLLHEAGQRLIAGLTAAQRAPLSIAAPHPRGYTPIRQQFDSRSKGET